MKIPKTKAYRWAYGVRLTTADWLRREGWGEAKLVQAWIAQAKRSRGHVLNGVLREIGLILGVYPANKKPPPQAPVTVVFDTDLSHYKDEIYAAKPDAKTLLVEG